MKGSWQGFLSIVRDCDISLDLTSGHSFDKTAYCTYYVPVHVATVDWPLSQ